MRVASSCISLFSFLGLMWGSILGFAAEPPSLENQIDILAFDNSNRSIVIRVLHPKRPDGTSKLVSARLVREPAYVRYGDTGTIAVKILNYDGQTISSWLAKDPLLDQVSGTGDAAVGRYALPYSKDLAEVYLFNLSTGWQTEFKLFEVVSEFCANKPNDVACEKVDLTVDVVRLSEIPDTMRVGETIDVRLQFTAKNLGDDTGGGSITVAPIFVSPNLALKTSEQVNFGLDRIPSGFDWIQTIAYRLTCLEPGSGRIFPGIEFRTNGFAHIVDAIPANNKSNLIFDVTCVAN